MKSKTPVYEGSLSLYFHGKMVLFNNDYSPPAAIALRTPAPIVHLPHTAAEIPPAAIITD